LARRSSAAYGDEADGVMPLGEAFVRGVFSGLSCSASFAKRSARRRAVFLSTASFSASYSRIASAASRARSSFLAAMAARCSAFFKIATNDISSVTTALCGHGHSKRNPATGGPGGVQPQALPVHPWSKRYGHRRCRLDGAQVLSGRLARPMVCDDVKRDLLPFVEAAHSRAFNRADMNEDIFVTALWLNEAEALLAVKPLYSSLVHGTFSLHVYRSRADAAGCFEILEGRSLVRRALRGVAKPFGRNSICMI